jgi:hypothetical protein
MPDLTPSRMKLLHHPHIPASLPSKLKISILTNSKAKLPIPISRAKQAPSPVISRQKCFVGDSRGIDPQIGPRIARPKESVQHRRFIGLSQKATIKHLCILPAWLVLWRTAYQASRPAFRVVVVDVGITVVPSQPNGSLLALGWGFFSLWIDLGTRTAGLESWDGSEG